MHKLIALGPYSRLTFTDKRHIQDYLPSRVRENNGLRRNPRLARINARALRVSLYTFPEIATSIERAILWKRRSLMGSVETSLD